MIKSVLAPAIAVSIALTLGCSPQILGQGQTTGQGSNVHDYQACMKCRYATTGGAGKCLSCKAQKVQIRGRAVSVCPKDQEVFPKSKTKCTKHKADLVARVLTYYCSADKSSSSQSGNCSKCGKFRNKHVLLTSAPR